MTSAAWGATVGSCVGLAYVRADERVTEDLLATGGWQVDVAGTLVPVRLSLKAPVS